jgi:Carboxypeptidase regulatory-like domain
MFSLRIGLICTLLVTASVATNIHEMRQYKSPVRRVQGEVIDVNGATVSFVDVAVFNNPGVWFDDSLSFEEKRKRQSKIAGATTDDNGRFSLKKLRKGSYELQFTKGGLNTLSVIVQIDPSTQPENLCVRMATSGTPEEPLLQPCPR